MRILGIILTVLAIGFAGCKGGLTSISAPTATGQSVSFSSGIYTQNFDGLTGFVDVSDKYFPVANGKLLSQVNLDGTYTDQTCTFSFAYGNSNYAHNSISSYVYPSKYAATIRFNDDAGEAITLIRSDNSGGTTSMVTFAKAGAIQLNGTNVAAYTFEANTDYNVEVYWVGTSTSAATVTIKVDGETKATPSDSSNWNNLIKTTVPYNAFIVNFTVGTTTTDSPSVDNISISPSTP